MKRSDFATIALIAGFSAIVAFALANIFLGDPNNESVTVQYMDLITGDLAQPDPELFNPFAINPTVEIYVGQCRENETWDDVAGSCVSNEPSTPEEDDEDEEEETDTESDESTEEPATPGQ